MLRAEIKNETKLGLEAKSFIDAGQLVPDSVVIGMIEAWLNAGNGANGVIFDGFPRTIAQADALSSLLEKRNSKINAVLDLQVDEEELIKRLINRGKESGRSDDNLETITKRLETYKNQTSPLADYYKEKALHHAIKGVGSLDEIHARISEVVDSL